MSDSHPGHDPFTIPADRATGCLPRVSKPGQWCPFVRDSIRVIPRNEWPDLVGTVPNSDLIWELLDQDGVGSCAAEGCTNAVLGMRELAGADRVQLNPWGLYNTTSGGSDRGSSIDENLSLARSQGIPSMAVWPRSKGWRTRLSAEALEDAKQYRIDEFYDVTNHDEFASALFAGFLVEFGYRIGGGGHAVCATEMVSTSRFRFINSWGQWGQNGFGELNLSDIYWGFGAWALRTTTIKEPSWPIKQK